ncbi:energy transducer TonB [Bacteroidota bacterium]
MSKNKKYENIDPEDLMRYSANGLSDEERHALERESQKDPFMEEALEGYSSLSADQVREDLSRLQSRLNRRISGRATMVWVRIAATVAIILTIGTLYFTVFSDRLGKMDRTVAETESTESTMEVDVPDDLKTMDEIGKEETDVVEKSDEGRGEEVAAPPIIESQPGDQEETLAEDITGDSEPEPIVAEETLIVEDDSQIKDSFFIVEMEELEDLADEDVSAELVEEPRARQTIAQPTAIVELAEDRAAGLEASKSMAKKESRSPTGAVASSVYEVPDSIPAMPLGGLENFNRYIEENAHFPEELILSADEVVILTFEINPEGRPENIKIEESSGEAFSLEAVRLLERGPTWSPAIENGTPVAKRNRLKLEFNRE